MRRSMRNQRDLRSRSRRTGRFVRDRRYEPIIETDFHNGERLRGSRWERDYGDYNENRDYGDYDYDDYDDDRDYRSHGMRRRDYGENEDKDCYLSKRELMEWAKELLEEVPEQDKSMFTRDAIERKAQEMAIDFKHFTFGELYTTALMLYTDFHKTLGGGNAELFLKLAKNFLEDDDIELDGGEKLYAYYENIVCAE